LIEHVLREFPSVKIVISSAWRDYHSMEDLTKFFAADMRARVAGTTLSARRLANEMIRTEFERQWACELWMDESRSWVTLWLAINDWPNWFEPNCKNLLVTDPKTGFRLEDQQTLRQMLRERT
jgi:hypothetical protein